MEEKDCDDKTACDHAGVHDAFLDVFFGTSEETQDTALMPGLALAPTQNDPEERGYQMLSVKQRIYAVYVPGIILRQTCLCKV